MTCFVESKNKETYKNHRLFQHMTSNCQFQNVNTDTKSSYVNANINV